tara:strand:+ start:1079 stop:1909 length:831 start_codon:yes stop_codon:yes gene_type:complete
MKKLLQAAGSKIPYRIRGWVKHIPGIKQLQHSLFESHLSGEAFTHQIQGGPADGLNYPIQLPQDKQIWIGTYEQEFSERLAALIQPGYTCYDIGGYRGYFSGVMSRQGASTVHTFEPFPENITQINKMVELNPSSKILVHQMALADQTGETEFVVMPESSMGKLGNSNFDSGDDSTEKIQVTIGTIDALIDNGSIAPANLLKIDVEGAEAMVLKGGQNMIEKFKPLFLIEVHSRKLCKECVEFLAPLGYSFSILETNNAPNYGADPEVCHLVALPQ